MTDFDPWALSTGLSEVVSGEITDAYFSFDNSYDNGNTCVLKLIVADPTLGEQTLLYPCKDFEPYDNGERVRHTSGEQRNFNKQSGVGLLFDSAFESGVGDVLRERGQDPFTASIWKGLNLTFRNREFSYTDRKTDEKRTYSRMLVAGLNDGTTTEPATAEQTGGAAADVVAGLDPALRGKLRAVAIGAADSNEFVEKAFTDASLSIPSELEASVVDPAFYEALRASS